MRIGKPARRRPNFADRVYAVDGTGATAEARPSRRRPRRGKRTAEPDTLAVDPSDDEGDVSIKRPRGGRRKKAAADRRYTEQSRLRAVVGNATLTRNAVTVWFVERATSTSFRPHGEIEEQIESKAAVLSELCGRRIYWRISTRPYGARTFAAVSHADATKAGEPLPGWGDMLEREQRHMIGARLSEKWVYFGVRIATVRRYPRDARREMAQLAETVREVTDTVAGYGLDAVPAGVLDMEWLLQRSVRLGLPAPSPDAELAGDYEAEDLPELWERAHWSSEPYAKTLQVEGIGPNGEPVTRYVGILTMGRMAETQIPQSAGGGWMQRTDRLDFGVEWSATVDVLSNDRVVGKLRRRMDVIRDQYEHYTSDHGMDPPESLKRQRAIALAAEDDVSEGLGGLATRTEGWYRLAVWGASEKEVLDKIGQVKKLYGRQVSWWHNHDQYRLGREFIPGEPLANTAARRRMNVASLSAALPSATAEIGDRSGAVLGWTAGTSRRAVAWHLWADMEIHDRSGLTVVSGTLGSGKTLASAITVYRTVMAGAAWTIFDPSGRLGTLCDLPELSAHAEYVDLLKGRDGELNPYRVVAEPNPAHFRDKREWELEKQSAAAQRMSLCKDILRAFLPWAMRDSERAESVLTRAINAVGGAPTAAPNQVLQQLLAIAEAQTERDLTQDHRILARDIYTALSHLAETPKGRLIFPAGYATDRGVTHATIPRLRVYSLAGLEIPDAAKAARDESDEVRMSVALFNLAAWLTQRSIYQGNRDARKGLMIDEGHMLNVFAAGRSLIRKSATDSRKHNTRVLLSSQNVDHFDLGDIGNLVGSALIGRTTDDAAARSALKILGVDEADDAYVRILQRLSKQFRRPGEDDGGGRKWREFVFSDGRSGGAEKIIVDPYAHPHVFAALNSTPDATQKVA